MRKTFLYDEQTCNTKPIIHSVFFKKYISLFLLFLSILADRTMSENASQSDIVPPREVGTQSTCLNDNENENELTTKTRTRKAKSPVHKKILVIGDSSDEGVPSNIRALDLANGRLPPKSTAIVRSIHGMQLSNGDHGHHEQRYRFQAECNRLEEENAKLKKQVADLKDQIENLAQSNDNARREVCFFTYLIIVEQFHCDD
jgi:hypothetical protein